MTDGYRDWDADQATASTTTPEGGEYRDWDFGVPKETQPSTSGSVAKGVLAGATVGAGAFFGRGLLRKAFPGMMPKVSAFKKIDASIRKSDSSASLKSMMSKYLTHVSETDKPLSFADYIAQQPGHQNTVGVIKELVGGSGNVPKIEEALADRASGQKTRVLDDISGALGISPKSVVKGRDELIQHRKDTSRPLYDTAFADKNPLHHPDFWGLFEAPAARKSLSEIVTNAENELKPIDVRSAAMPGRKDWWKRAQAADIPEGLFLDDEPSSGLRRYIAPNLENADKVQQAIYARMKAAMKKDEKTGYEIHTPESRALDTLHKKFMDTLYRVGTPEYRTAREAYAGESALIGAHKVGTDLLRMSPDEVRKAIKGMTPDQREALASGFYGSLHDMQQQKFLREFVARPDRYPEKREVLSTVFRDPKKLDQFIANLKGEEAMADSAMTYSNTPPSRDALPRLPWMRATDAALSYGAGPKASILESASNMFGWPSRRASREATDFAFAEPTFYPMTVGHRNLDDVHDTPLSNIEMAKRLGLWSGYGGTVGGLSGLAASVPSGEDEHQVPSGLRSLSDYFNSP